MKRQIFSNERLPRFCKPRGWPSVWSKRATADEPIAGFASFNNESWCKSFASNSSFDSLSNSGQKGL
jgi:hypothetical protein